jgi:hypothetical protein
MNRPDEPDLLVGCRAITAYLNSLIAPDEKKFSQAAVYRLIEGQKIPTGRLTSQVIIASRRVIREHLERLAGGGEVRTINEERRIRVCKHRGTPAMRRSRGAAQRRCGIPTIKIGSTLRAQAGCRTAPRRLGAMTGFRNRIADRLGERSGSSTKCNIDKGSYRCLSAAKAAQPILVDRGKFRQELGRI